MTTDNENCIVELSDRELDHQIREATRDLNMLDSNTVAWEAAVDDLRQMFDERRLRGNSR